MILPKLTSYHDDDLKITITLRLLIGTLFTRAIGWWKQAPQEPLGPDRHGREKLV